MALLIADASSMSRRVIRNALEHGGFDDVIETPSALQALGLLDTHPISVVILGPEIGSMTGLQLAAQLRDMPKYLQTPLLMVSDRGSPEDVLDAVDCGIDEYVLVPFDEKHLVTKVRLAEERAAQLLASLKGASQYRHKNIVH